ncbi:predicted protein [Pyrenophora tritici-repentis Pt-1C-BFP]|uniref:Uncharacterized protein n=1 Tax=Pyrenophora tritici-repentis (strain Pt-1C-BFP) TaxID=426418 RepID=B2WQ70_PYRTR|nr:uncharacterized protein PTRG_12130 [Pyrenophora tritici-repentis Pt-1C-BFP]EDU47323.1 predicted protein [Pyrenophora tritici-repentis Pt-1C-BFP]
MTASRGHTLIDCIYCDTIREKGGYQNLHGFCILQQRVLMWGGARHVQNYEII